jgi:methylated-DNA-[protein]-cysteine S-methyltransferase
MNDDTRRVAMMSPIGTLVLEGDDEALVELRLPSPGSAKGVPRAGDARRARALGEPLSAALAQLEEYFAGKRRLFDLPLELSGTPFQRDVWTTLAEIPYGETVSYAELAAMVGRPTAFRAVGQANGAHPIPIVLPCHRVVASGGRIGGYGGGLPVKRKLLTLEGVPGDW